MGSLEPPNPLDAVVDAVLDRLADELIERIDRRLEARAKCDAPPAVEPLGDREQTAAAVGVSLRTLDRLRRQKGFPELKVGSAPRFELGAVKRWLATRKRPLRLVSGA